VFVVTVTWFDVLLVGHYTSTKDAAIYAVASRLFVAGSYALQAIGFAVSPQFSELLARHELAAAEAVYQAGTWWAMCVSWPFYLLLMIFPSTVLSLVFGGDYSGAGTALLILSASGLVDLATGNAQALLLMSGRSGVYAVNALVSLVANIGLNLVLIPRMGMTGAAIAWAVTIGLSNVAAALQVRFLLDIRPLGNGFRAAASSSLLAFAAIPLLARVVFGPGATGLAVGAALGTPVFLALVWSARGTLRLSDLARGALAAHRASVEASS
jgi:O-antigen/teichoic acid export membrane protein